MSEPIQKYCKFCGGAMGETEIGEHYSWRICAVNLKKREKELEARITRESELSDKFYLLLVDDPNTKLLADKILIEHCGVMK